MYILYILIPLCLLKELHSLHHTTYIPYRIQTNNDLYIPYFPSFKIHVICVSVSFIVSVTVFDQSVTANFDRTFSDSAPAFGLGRFVWEVPANVHTIIPSSAVQNKSVDILVQGANFRDSPGLSCLLNVDAVSAESDGECISIYIYIVSLYLYPLLYPSTTPHYHHTYKYPSIIIFLLQ